MRKHCKHNPFDIVFLKHNNIFADIFFVRARRLIYTSGGIFQDELLAGQTITNAFETIHIIRVFLCAYYNTI